MKHPLSLWPQVAKGKGSRCLIWTALRGCTSTDDENVEDHTRTGKADDNVCNSNIDFPEVTGEGTTEK